MNRIPALLRGNGLPKDGTARVVSVHQVAVNLLHQDGCLISLAANADYMTGRTLLLRSIPGRLPVGTSFVVSPQSLQAGERWQVDLGGAAEWEGAIQNPGSHWTNQTLRQGLRPALLKVGKSGGFLGLIDSRDNNPFAKRAQHILADGNQPALDRLVGLGPGFTPSGDDFLMGVLLSSRLGLTDFQPPRVVVSEEVLGFTTPGGRTLLSLSLRGSFPAYLVRLSADLVVAPTNAEIEKAAKRAAGFGETSGTDAMVGLLWALSTGIPSAL